MLKSYSPKPHNQVDYYPLPNGLVDVFMHRNDTTETGEDGNIVYVTEEAYIQVKSTTTKEYIESSFEQYWAFAENGKTKEATLEERLSIAEDTINFLLGL